MSLARLVPLMAIAVLLAGCQAPTPQPTAETARASAQHFAMHDTEPLLAATTVYCPYCGYTVIEETTSFPILGNQTFEHLRVTITVTAPGLPFPPRDPQPLHIKIGCTSTVECHIEREVPDITSTTTIDFGNASQTGRTAIVVSVAYDVQGPLDYQPARDVAVDIDANVTQQAWPAVRIRPVGGEKDFTNLAPVGDASNGNSLLDVPVKAPYRLRIVVTDASGLPDPGTFVTGSVECNALGPECRDAPPSTYFTFKERLPMDTTFNLTGWPESTTLGIDMRSGALTDPTAEPYGRPLNVHVEWQGIEQVAIDENGEPVL